MPRVRAASIRAPLPGLYNPELHELSIRQARHTTRQWAWIRAKTADNLHCVPSSPLGAQALTRRRLGPAAYLYFSCMEINGISLQARNETPV